MAIQFDPNALGRFADVNFRETDAIANLDGKDGLKKNGTRGWGVFSGWRLGGHSISKASASCPARRRSPRHS